MYAAVNEAFAQQTEWDVEDLPTGEQVEMIVEAAWVPVEIVLRDILAKVKK